VPPNAATVAAAAAAAQNIAVQQHQQAPSAPLPQQLVTNPQGQIVAIGGAQVTYCCHIHIRLFVLSPMLFALISYLSDFICCCTTSDPVQVVT